MRSPKSVGFLCMVYFIVIQPVNAAAEKLNCESHGVVSVTILGQTQNQNQGTLDGDLTVLIEDTIYTIEHNQVVFFQSKNSPEGVELQIRAVSETDHKTVLDLNWNKTDGQMSLDFKGISLNAAKTYCTFTH